MVEFAKVAMAGRGKPTAPLARPRARPDAMTFFLPCLVTAG
jgi:hypothetical protein